MPTPMRKGLGEEEEGKDRRGSPRGEKKKMEKRIRAWELSSFNFEKNQYHPHKKKKKRRGTSAPTISDPVEERGAGGKKKKKEETPTAHQDYPTNGIRRSKQKGRGGTDGKNVPSASG